MKLVFSLKKNLSQKQKEFILTSLNNSFPKHTFFFSKNRLFSKNDKDFGDLKKSFIKLLKITEHDTKKIIFAQKNTKKFKKNPLPILQKKKQVLNLSKKRMTNQKILQKKLLLIKMRLEKVNQTLIKSFCLP